MRLTALSALVCLPLAAAAPASKGFDHFYNLEYEEAIAEFEREVRVHPEDPYSYTHLAQALLYREMFNSGALETELVTGSNVSLARTKVHASEAEQRRFDEAIARAIAFSEKRLAANASDTAALYSLGVAHSLRSNYNFLVRKSWRDALREFTQARKVHQRALEIKPDFVDAQFAGGVHDYIVGSLPFAMKMLGFLIGFRGDKEGGIRTVERVAAEGSSSRVDAMILLAVAYRRERQPEKAVPLLKQLIALYPRNYLFRLEMVQMYGDMVQKEEALALLKQMEDGKARGAAAFKRVPLGKIHYSRGNLLFWYRDYNLAIADLNRVSADAGLNTQVNAWLRLGQCYDVLGRRQEALRSYRLAIDNAPDSDAAREARRHLGSAYRRAAVF